MINKIIFKDFEQSLEIYIHAIKFNFMAIFVLCFLGQNTATNRQQAYL